MKSTTVLAVFATAMVSSASPVAEQASTLGGYGGQPPSSGYGSPSPPPPRAASYGAPSREEGPGVIAPVGPPSYGGPSHEDGPGVFVESGPPLYAAPSREEGPGVIAPAGPPSYGGPSHENGPGVFVASGPPMTSPGRPSNGGYASPRGPSWAGSAPRPNRGWATGGGWSSDSDESDSDDEPGFGGPGGFVPGRVPNTYQPAGGPELPPQGGFPAGSPFNSHSVESYASSCSSNTGLSCCNGNAASGGLIPIDILGGDCTLSLVSDTCTGGDVHCCPTKQSNGFTLINIGSFCNFVHL